MESQPSEAVSVEQHLAYVEEQLVTRQAKLAELECAVAILDAVYGALDNLPDAERAEEGFRLAVETLSNFAFPERVSLR